MKELDLTSFVPHVLKCSWFSRLRKCPQLLRLGEGLSTYPALWTWIIPLPKGRTVTGLSSCLSFPWAPESTRGAGTLSSEPEKGVLLPGLEASQTALWELLDFEGQILGSFCSTWTSRESQEDIMGCCSGRCTLAFICGMQLVSAYVTIDPVRGGKSGLNLWKAPQTDRFRWERRKKASLFGDGAEGEVGGWREGEMDYSKVTFQKLIKGHDTRNDVLWRIWGLNRWILLPGALRLY